MKKESLEEMWVPVRGHEGYYDVSNMGRIRSNIIRRYKYPHILNGSKMTNGYLQVFFRTPNNRKQELIHRVVALHFLKEPPKHKDKRLVVDHINGIRSDNRASNLRFVTDRFNCTYGKRKDSVSFSSKYPGVSFKKDHKKWRALILVEKKSIHLGYFDKEEDAYLAYRQALSLMI